MSILEDIFGTVGKVVQKPQSIAMGMFNEASGQADELRDFMHKYEYALVDDTEENAAKYAEAQRIVSSSATQDNSGVGALVNPAQLLGGAVQGAKENITPSDMLVQSGINNPVGNVAADVLLDPTLALGGVGSKLPGTAGKLANSATTFGKLGEEAGKADKAAQAARYLYQGLMAGGGDVSTGLGVAGLMPVGERVAGRVGAKLFSRAGTQIADDLVGNGLDKKFTQTGLDKVESEYQNALRLLGQDMPEASLLGKGVDVEGPGFSMQSKGNLPVPYRGTGNPTVDEARAYLSATPGADAADVLFDVPGVGSMDQATEVLRAAKAGVDKSSIPLSDRGALFNKQLMDDLGWDGQLVDTQAPRLDRMLSPAPTATPMGAAPKGTAVEQYIQELGPLPIQQTPTGYGAMDIQQFGPKPQALPAGVGGEPIPVGPGIQPGQTSPFVSRPPGMDPDVEMLKQVLADALRQRNKAPLALNAGRSPQEELLFKLAGGM